ncbi:MAG TPA: hypothetical protein VMV68_03215 [Spirochaetia bacterium]|nr:hypothetical protein [Spirochaetia bacterium]
MSARHYETSNSPNANGSESPSAKEHGAFPLLFLIGRPAAGKSEVIKYLKGVSESERSARLHVAAFQEFDDFPMIWNWFEEDAILARHGRARLHTDPEGYFLDPFLWHVLVERLELDYRKWALEFDGAHASAEQGGESLPAAPQGRTAVVEFARGKEHGGLAEAFAHLSPAILRRGAVLYIRVSYAESLRKNRRRFNPEKPHSILEHSLPDEKLARLYGESDWEELEAKDPAYLQIGGVRVPYAVMENEDDVTTAGGAALGERLSKTLALLWERYERAQRG